MKAQKLILSKKEEMQIYADIHNYYRYGAITEFKTTTDTSQLELIANFILSQFSPANLEQIGFASTYLLLLKNMNQLDLDTLKTNNMLCCKLLLVMNVLQLSSLLEKEYEPEFFHEILEQETILSDKLSIIANQEKNQLKNEIEKRIEEFDFSPAPFSHIDPSYIWRLFVDGELQQNPIEQGWIGYEKREKGCLIKMVAGLKYALESYLEPISFSLLDKIHNIAARSVACLSDSSSFGRGANTHIGYFTFSLYSLVEIATLPETRYFNPQQRDWQNVDEDNICLRIKRPFAKIGHEEVKTEISSILSEYNQHLNKAKSTKNILEQLKAITRLCSRLVRLHPYKDGNARVFVTLLLNRELYRNNFPPCILANPNWFDNLGTYELINEVLNGMSNFRYVAKHGVYPGTDDISVPNWYEKLTDTDKDIIKVFQNIESESKDKTLSLFREHKDLSAIPSETKQKTSYTVSSTPI